MKKAQAVFEARLRRAGGAGYVVLPIDPKAVFGKVRAPIKVTLNGYSFRTTIATMGGPPCIGMRTSQREEAGLNGGELVEVRVELDEEPRVVTPPADLAKALKAAPPAWDRWGELSFTHQREHAEAVESAKKPETRARRIANAVAMLKAAKPRAAKKAAKPR
jgi:hypothetical protein